MIVVDTNVIAYLHVSGEYSAQAEQARRKDPNWVAPLLWRSEMRNVLALYLRRRLLTLSEVRRIMDEAQEMMEGHEYEVASFRVFEEVARGTCSAYDCEYVALARLLGVRFVTCDKKILSQFPDMATALKNFTE